MNLKESDALVGIDYLQMPTTRGRIIRLDANAIDWSQSDLNVRLTLSCELIGGAAGLIRLPGEAL